MQASIANVKSGINQWGKFTPHIARAHRHELKAEAEGMLQFAMSKGRDLQGEEITRFNEIVANVNALSARIEAHIASVEGATVDSGLRLSPQARLDNPGANTALPSRPGMKSSLRDLYNQGGEVREQVEEISAYLTGQIAATANLRPSSDGGVLIPTTVANALVRDYAQFSPVVSVARKWATDTGENAVFPVLSDSDVAVQLNAEDLTGADATVSGDAPPTALTGPTLGAYKLSSKPVFIPRETSTDSAIDIVSEVVGALLARIVRTENNLYTNGTGSSQCQGFLTGATKYVAGAVALDLDNSLDLTYSVPPLYRQNGVYMASDATIKYLRKLKTGLSGDKTSLWREAFEEGNGTLGTPARLHGYPILVNNDMPSVGSDGTFAGVNPLAFGDFSKFLVRQAENNQPYTYRYFVPAKDGVGVVLFRRSDSRLLVPTAISKMAVS